MNKFLLKKFFNLILILLLLFIFNFLFNQIKTEKILKQLVTQKLCKNNFDITYIEEENSNLLNSIAQNLKIDQNFKFSQKSNSFQETKIEKSKTINNKENKENKNKENKKEEQVINFPININTANVDQLCAIPGIGPVLAQRIIDYRNENGPYSKPDDLLKVKGIGEKKLQTLLQYITF